MDTASKKVSDILDNYRAASNLVTELEYWKARCKAAEAFNAAIGRKESPEAHKAWQTAIECESDKGKYLETLESATDGHRKSNRKPKARCRE